MPGFDQTGPEGRGSMTGRRMGRCANYGSNLKKTEPSSSGNQNENQTGNFSGRGYGSGLKRGGKGGRGRGMGLQNRFQRGF